MFDLNNSDKSGRGKFYGPIYFLWDINGIVMIVGQWILYLISIKFNFV